LWSLLKNQPSVPLRIYNSGARVEGCDEAAGNSKTCTMVGVDRFNVFHIN